VGTLFVTVFVPEMTYNVLSGTLSLYTTACYCLCDIGLRMCSFLLELLHNCEVINNFFTCIVLLAVIFSRHTAAVSVSAKVIMCWSQLDCEQDYFKIFGQIFVKLLEG